MNAKQPNPQVLVVFGASGDLARRKILPALYSLAAEDLLPEEFAVVGYARTEKTDEGFREEARQAIEEALGEQVAPDVWKRFAPLLSYVPGDFTTPGCMAHLGEYLARLDQDRGTQGRRLYYAATPPKAFTEIVARIGEVGPTEGARIVIEKPFGSDLASARALNEQITKVFPEEQIFRIDHYLGKETVQNLLVFRFSNAMFERVWNRDAVDHVQITVAEAIGVEGRGRYYEQAGAIRDILQNHIMQMLAFLTMEPPRSLEPAAIHDEKVKVLRTMRAFEPSRVVRAQYRGYRDEEGVSPSSTVETFVGVEAFVDNWRWTGVPFYLRTGKLLPERRTEITVVFKDAPSYLWEDLDSDAMEPDRLTLRIQPEEGGSLAFQAKEPGVGLVPRTVEMDFTYAEYFKARQADAYERLLRDAMVGDSTLFPRWDAVERAWQIVEPVLDGHDEPSRYAPGSWGPQASDELIAPRRWLLG